MPTVRRPEVPPPGTINLKESMTRKAQGRWLSLLTEKPPPAYDAGLITADRPGGGFCINCPETNPIGDRSPPGTGGLVRVFAGPSAGSRSQWVDLPKLAGRSNSSSKICVLSSIGCPSGRGWGRERPDSMDPRGSRSHEVPRFFESVIVPSQLAAVSMPTVGVADPDLLLEDAVPRGRRRTSTFTGGT